MSANVFELQGSISMNSDGFEKAIKDAIAEGKKLVQSLAENTSAMKALQDSVDKARAEVDSAAKAMKDTSDASAEMKKEVDKADKAFDEAADSASDMSKKTDKASDAVDDMADSLDKEKDKAEKSGKETDKYGDAADEAADDTKKLNKEAGGLSSTFDGLIDKVGKAAGAIKDGLVVAAKVGAGAVAAAGAAVGAYTKSAFDAYSAYEQNVGAMDKLFGESSQQMQQYAKEAAKTAGVSQNEFMEIAESFSGAILSATGRGEQTDIDQLKKTLDEKYDLQKEYWDDVIKNADSSQKDALRKQKNADLKALKETNKAAIEEAEKANKATTTTAESQKRAAELTNQAIIDMSDMANTYSMTVEQVADTYKSLARGNYQTLDNLFGSKFAGTKAGLEDMLTYAEQYRASLGETVSYSTDSFADIVSAIHDVSEAERVAGTTHDEAQRTLEGSTRAMAAAWENLKIAIASGDVTEIESNITELVGNVETVIRNAEPVIERILSGIGTAIESLAPVVSQKVPELIKDLLPSAVTAVTSLVTNIIGALPEALKVLTDPSTISTILIAVQDMLSAVVTGLANIVELAPDIIPGLLQQVGLALLNSINLISGPLEDMIYDLSRLIQKSLPVLIPIVLDLFKAILNSVATLSSALLPELADIVVTLFEELGEQDMAEVSLALINALSAIFAAIADAGEIIADNLTPILTTLTDLLIKGFDEHGEEIGDAVNSMLLNLLKATGYVLMDGGTALLSTIGQFFYIAILAFMEGIALPIADKLSDWGVFITEWGMDLWAKIADWFKEKIDKIAEFFEGIGEKIYDFKADVVEKIGEIIGSITSKFTGLLDNAKNWGKDLIDNFLGGITDKLPNVSGAMSTVADKIGEYIHFSEPDKGALADFHTFAPDMMKLFAQGIADNANLVYDEINSLTNGISNDLAVEASPVAPAIATNGAVNNYSVNISFDGATISENTDLDNLSDTLIEKISEGLAMLDVFQTRAYGGVTI